MKIGTFATCAYHMTDTTYLDQYAFHEKYVVSVITYVWHIFTHTTQPYNT